jgi:hypothetical protein
MCCACSNVTLEAPGSSVPVAVGFGLEIDEDAITEITLIATDDDGDDLSFEIVDPPEHGELGSIDGSAIQYTPDSNYNGLDSFSYRANDGSSDSEIVLVSIDLAPVNDAPTLSSVSAFSGATEDVDFEISYDDLAGAADAADVEGDSLSFRIEAVSTGTLKIGITDVTPGTTTLSAGETLIWKGATNANGDLNAFTVRALDATATSSAAIQVEVAVDPVAEWTRIDALGQGQWGDSCNNKGISISANGQKMAVCSNTLRVSTDYGETWSGNLGSCECVAYSGNGNKLIVTRDGGAAYSDNDGVSFVTSAITKTGGNFYNISVSANGSKVAIVDSTDFDTHSGSLYISTDGGLNFSSPVSDWVDFGMIPGYKADGSEVALFSGDSQPILRSTDDFLGNTASTPVTSSYPDGGIATSDLSKFFVNMGSGGIWKYTLSNSSFSLLTSPTADANFQTSALAASSDAQVLLANWGALQGGGYLYLSRDGGSSWTQQTPPGQGGGWYSSSMSADGNIFIAGDHSRYVWIYK